MWVPGEGECSWLCPALLPLLPLAALGKPVASDTPKMLWSLPGPQGEGGRAPGCPGTEWTRPTCSATRPPPLPLPPLQLGTKHCHAQHQTANANICHLGLPCEPAHLLQVFPKQWKRRRWKANIIPGKLHHRCCGSLHQGLWGMVLGEGRDAKTQPTVYRVPGSCAVGRLEDCTWLWGRRLRATERWAVALLLLSAEEGWAFRGSPEAGVYSEQVWGGHRPRAHS